MALRELQSPDELERPAFLGRRLAQLPHKAIGFDLTRIHESGGLLTAEFCRRWNASRRTEGLRPFQDWLSRAVAIELRPDREAGRGAITDLVEHSLTPSELPPSPTGPILVAGTISSSGLKRHMAHALTIVRPVSIAGQQAIFVLSLYTTRRALGLRRVAANVSARRRGFLQPGSVHRTAVEESANRLFQRMSLGGEPYLISSENLHPRPVSLARANQIREARGRLVVDCIDRLVLSPDGRRKRLDRRHVAALLALVNEHRDREPLARDRAAAMAAFGYTPKNSAAARNALSGAARVLPPELFRAEGKRRTRLFSPKRGFLFDMLVLPDHAQVLLGS